MKNTKVLRFVQSLILLPITTMTTMSAVPVGPAVGSLAQGAVNMVSQNSLSAQIVFSQKLNNSEEENKVLDLKAKAEAIDTYFKSRGMPLIGKGMKMVEEAEKHDLDWRLIAAIAVRESTGGKFACKRATHNPFGWGSCKINFKSTDDAIETIARNLGGNNPKTARHYDNKTTLQILNAYNPPSIVPKYASQVMAIMKAIGPENIISSDNTA